MRYAKLIDDQIQFAPRKLIVGEYVVYNPTPEMLIAAGWKPVHIDQYPEEDPPEGYYWAIQWSQDDHNIYGHWASEPIIE